MSCLPVCIEMKRLVVGLEMGQQSRVGKVLRATRMTGMASN